MTGVLKGVLEGYVFFGERGIARGLAGKVDVGDGGRVGGCDGGLVRWRAVVGVLEDACVDGVSFG